jgi:hypothetical protein
MMPLFAQMALIVLYVTRESVQQNGPKRQTTPKGWDAKPLA